MVSKGENAGNIKFGNSFSHDRHYGTRFDYLLANSPFGVEWKKVRDDIEREAGLGYAGRFGAGMPGINDGSLLFLQHMIHHMQRPEEGGARLAIALNGSPLFTGAAESGESRIRQWILENDWLEAIVALPDQLFYNTGISTYFWILTNRKDDAHRGGVVLLDAREHWEKMRKSLGDKRKYVPGEDIDEYLAREVRPHVPDAWVDYEKTKIGYEIPFTRYFYKYVPPRPLEKIDAELKKLEGRIQRLLSEVTE